MFRCVPVHCSFGDRTSDCGDLADLIEPLDPPASSAPEAGAVRPRAAENLMVTAVTCHMHRRPGPVRATEIPVTDFFWGERYGQVRDAYGHVWGLASRIEDVSPQEIAARAEAFYRRDRS